MPMLRRYDLAEYVARRCLSDLIRMNRRPGVHYESAEEILEKAVLEANPELDPERVRKMVAALWDKFN